MAKYRVIYDREACIGAFACVAVAPDFWEFADDGKADLKNAKDLGNGKFEIIIDEKDYEANFSAAEACPVAVIMIEKIDENE